MQAWHMAPWRYQFFLGGKDSRSLTMSWAAAPTSTMGTRDDQTPPPSHPTHLRHWRWASAHPDVVEGVSLVVRIVDEAVPSIVPLGKGDPQLGVHILQKLAAIMDGLQGQQCPD